MPRRGVAQCSFSQADLALICWGRLGTMPRMTQLQKRISTVRCHAALMLPCASIPRSIHVQPCATADNSTSGDESLDPGKHDKAALRRHCVSSPAACVLNGWCVLSLVLRVLCDSLRRMPTLRQPRNRESGHAPPQDLQWANTALVPRTAPGSRLSCRLTWLCVWGVVVVRCKPDISTIEVYIRRAQLNFIASSLSTSPTPTTDPLSHSRTHTHTLTHSQWRPSRTPPTSSRTRSSESCSLAVHILVSVARTCPRSFLSRDR